MKRQACRAVSGFGVALLLAGSLATASLAGVFKPPQAYYDIPRGPAYRQPMSFSFERSPQGQETIFATGRISSKTPAALQDLLAQSNAHAGATIYFHASGGDTDAAMQLGRLIRKQSLQTSVGQRIQAGEHRDPTRANSDPGVCVGPCTLAFLGGVTRTLPPGSFFDMFLTNNDLDHRHYFDKGTFIAQKWSAAIGAYLAEMSIKPVFYQFATLPLSTQKDRTHYLPDRRELRAWNVTTDPYATHWDVQIRNRKFWLVGANPDSPLLKGVHNEIAFGCEAPNLYVMKVSYLPLPDFRLPPDAKYGFVRQKSPEDERDVPTGKEDSGDLTIRPQWVWANFTKEPNGPRLTGSIVLTPEIIDFLEHSDVVSFQFYVGTGWPAQLPIEFSSGDLAFQEFIKAPCN
jgi:hypothetical protein